ncbi:Holliday junction resolvase RuvX [Nesterenkonia alkaliphila]|uniref:Putative pre-16S rRNA nuclease n=1 Tax=Nesterenkonia alkaliphila TaxID=1463631 RepID=A0A7K1UM40_9MICC|nr:Holliday junction resolvase RuvX [Nesterenkonia alkaliphila]MVT27523.1 Holliday junction resolvase RuvX [Nesterenkonia alkaliphila]GFZ80389.1 putative pre-16S rRNA nuclease [Nesterenkonia alkaliphila]
MRAGVRLAVDVGEARVGLAATDPDALVATPVMTLRRDKNRNGDIRMIVKIARDRGARLIYVGLPLSLSGEDTPSTQKARDYAAELKRQLTEAQLNTGVQLIDERLTTVSAAEKMRASGRSAREQKEAIDQAAAVEILNHALQMRTAGGAEPGQDVIHSSD